MGDISPAFSALTYLLFTVYVGFSFGASFYIFLYVSIFWTENLEVCRSYHDFTSRSPAFPMVTGEARVKPVDFGSFSQLQDVACEHFQRGRFIATLQLVILGSDKPGSHLESPAIARLSPTKWAGWIDFSHFFGISEGTKDEFLIYHWVWKSDMASWEFPELNGKLNGKIVELNGGFTIWGNNSHSFHLWFYKSQCLIGLFTIWESNIWPAGKKSLVSWEVSSWENHQTCHGLIARGYHVAIKHDWPGIWTHVHRNCSR